MVLDALSPLISGEGGGSVAGGEGAIYYYAKLPVHFDDERVYEWLVARHGVCVIPGSSVGDPGVNGVWGMLGPRCEYDVGAAAIPIHTLSTLRSYPGCLRQPETGGLRHCRGSTQDRAVGTHGAGGGGAGGAQGLGAVTRLPSE